MSEPTLFDPSPGLVRRDHQATAQAAAVDVYPRSGTQRYRVLLDIFAAGEEGRTRDEIAEGLNMSPNTVRPRVKELLDAGWITTNGQTRPSLLGRHAEVLIVTDRA